VHAGHDADDVAIDIATLLIGASVLRREQAGAASVPAKGLPKRKGSTMGTVRPDTACLQIDLAKVCRNYQYMRSLVSQKVNVAAVVKSDAYGLGLVPVATALARAGCRLFFVANLDEGTLLRAACSTASIAVFRDDVPRYLPIYERQRLIPVANCAEDVRLLAGNSLALPFMIQIETGFSRLGLDAQELGEAIPHGECCGLDVVALVSHLACSDVPGDGTNERQLERFQNALQRFRPACASLSASAGVWLGPRYHFDMVRVGSALYGLNNARITPNPLVNVVRLKAQIVHVRDVAPNEIVGYAGTFRTSRKSRIAVAGIGYVQGLPWSAGNRIEGRLGPFAAPVIGRISMEYITLDATEIPESVCHPGAWVDLLDAHCGPDELAERIGVTAQELLVRLGACCRRAYCGALDDDATRLRAAASSRARMPYIGAERNVASPAEHHA
jgi:alanine racemase